MAYKKQKWMQYGRRGNIIEIKIKDESDRTIDFFKCNNKEAFKTIAKILKNKYGFDFTPEIDVNGSVNTEKQIENEKNWLEKDFEW